MPTTPFPQNQPAPEELEAYFRFRRALRKADQLVLDDLFESAKQHAALAPYAPHALSIEVTFLSMLLEEYKTLQVLRQQVDVLKTAADQNKLPPLPAPAPATPPPARVDPGFGFDDEPKG